MTAHDNLKIRGTNLHTTTLGVESDIPIYASTRFTIGVITGITLPSSRTTKKCWDEYLGQPAVNGMKWHNRCLRRMGMWYQDAHSDHSKLPRSIVTRKRRRESCSTSLYMRDMATQPMWSFRILIGQ